MGRLELYSQTRMPTSVLPLPECRTPTFRSYAEMFESEFVDDQWKLDWIWRAKDLETMNGLTKKDLMAALKWLAEYALEV